MSLFNNKYAKNIKRFICIMLLTSLIIVSPIGDNVSKVKAAKENTYIKELVLSYGKTYDEAENWLKQHKYKVVPGDINEGTGSDSNVVLMGYKTTTDAYDAIKDISVMPMTGGFKVTDIDTIMEKQKKIIDDSLNQFLLLADTYRANYKKAIKDRAKGGKGYYTAALKAHDILNTYIEDDSDKGMGDLLLEDFKKEENTEYLRKIIIEANPQIVAMLSNTLLMAGDDEDDTWIDRLSKNNKKQSFFDRMIKTYKTKNRAKKYLDEKYDDYKDAIIGDFESFRTTLLEAVYTTDDITEKYGAKANESQLNEYFDLKQYEIKDINEDMSEKEFTQAFDDNLDAVENGNKAQQYMENLSVIDYLIKHPYNNGDLYDFFTKKRDFSNDADKYEVYSILEAMDEATLEHIGESINIYAAVKYAMLNEEDTWNNKKTKEYEKQIDEFMDDIEKVSIYTGVNREVFKGEVAITSLSDTRTANFTTQSEGNIGNTILAGSFIALGAVETAIGGMVVMQGLKYISKAADPFWLLKGSYNTTETFMKGLGDKMLGNDVKAFYNFVESGGINRFEGQRIVQYQGSGAAKAQVRNVMKVSAGIVVAIGVILAVIGIILSAINIWKIVKERKEERKGDYSVKIPEFMADVIYDTDGTEDYVFYEACKCNRNDNGMTGKKHTDEGLKDFGDINGDCAKYWTCMYTTKDSFAGKPILADSLSVKKGEVKFDEDVTQIHSFNEKNTGFNFTSIEHTFSDDKGGTYVSFKREKKDNKNDDTGSIFNTKNQQLVIPGVIAGTLLGALGVFCFRKKENES